MDCDGDGDADGDEVEDGVQMGLLKLQHDLISSKYFGFRSCSVTQPPLGVCVCVSAVHR